MSIKVCVIGCGNHSANIHGPSLKRIAGQEADVKLAACCDLNEAKAAGYRDRFGFEKAYSDMDAMLTAEHPDAVLVVVPEHLICDTAIHVLQKKNPVELEKPPGLCAADTKRLIAAAEEAGVQNQVAFNRRHMPLMTKMREMLESLPGVQNIQYDFTRVARREPSFETTSIHGIDALKRLVGSDYRSVRFSYQPLPEQGENVVNIFMDCVFENGITAQLRFLPCAGTVTERITAVAAGHTIYLETPIWDGFDAPGRLVHVQEGNIVETITGLDVSSDQDMYMTNGFYHETKAFLQCIRSSLPCKDDVRSALQSVELAECIKLRREFYHKSI